jgi:pyrroline-5-carboxylate reductase
MASAMIGGLLRNGICKPEEIRVIELDAKKHEQLKSWRIIVFDEPDIKAISKSEIVVLAVKPQQIQEAVSIQLGGWLSSGQIVLSIAAGIRLGDLAKWLQNQSTNYVLVRAMPNTPALIGAGITGLYSFPPLNDKQRKCVENVISATGAFIWLKGEEDMDAVTAISGSGPAYFFYFIEALEQAGMELGLPQETARKLALETAYGAAKLAHESAEDPATLRARVTSKNGTTERALLSMEANHVKQHIITAAKAAAARSREMGDELGAA